MKPIEFKNVVAMEIDQSGLYLTFRTEAETEAAVLYCIEDGIEFIPIGRYRLIIPQAEYLK